MVSIHPDFHYDLSYFYGRPTVHKDTTYRDLPRDRVEPVQDNYYEVYDRKMELVRRERQGQNVNFIIA